MCDETEIYLTIKVLMGRRERRKVRKKREIWNLGLFSGRIASRPGWGFRAFGGGFGREKRELGRWSR